MITPVGKSEKIPLSYQLDDGPTAPTRYVQAVLLKASDRSTLATVNLTDNGEGDFSDYSKTPLSIELSNGDYFEAIYSVYKDSGYTNRDTLRYVTTKEVFVVKDTSSGIIMGSGLRGAESRLNLAELAEEIVKKIFRFNKWSEIKTKTSFANKFIELTKDSKNTDVIKSISSLEKMVNSSNEIIKSMVEDLAELVVKQGKAIISDLSTAIEGMEVDDDNEELEAKIDGFEQKIDQYQGILGDINTKIDKLQDKNVDLSSLEKGLQEIKQQVADRIKKEDERTLQLLKINKGYRIEVRKSLIDIENDIADILNNIK